MTLPFTANNLLFNNSYQDGFEMFVGHERKFFSDN